MSISDRRFPTKRSADHRRPRFPEYPGFHSPGPTTLELGPPQFWPVVHISHRLVREWTLRRTNTIRKCPQRDRVNAFFLEIYMSAAEPLPHERYLAKGVATV